MKRLTLLALVLAAGAVSAAPKADAEKGKQVATTICAACHAADGNSGIATYPKLAGQPRPTPTVKPWPSKTVPVRTVLPA